jgi:hypothetical protein
MQSLAERRDDGADAGPGLPDADLAAARAAEGGASAAIAAADRRVGAPARALRAGGAGHGRHVAETFSRGYRSGRAPRDLPAVDARDAQACTR